MPVTALTLLTLLSGLFVAHSASWNLFHRILLFLHPSVGVLWVIAILWSLKQAGIGSKRRMLKFHTAGAGLLFLGIAASFLSARMVWIVLAIVLCGILVLSYGLRGQIKRPIPTRLSSSGLMRSLFSYSVYVVAATGILIVLMSSTNSIRTLFHIHTLSGLVLVCIVTYLIASRLLRSDYLVWDTLTPMTGIRFGPKATEIMTLAVAGVAALVLLAREPQEQDVQYTFHLSTVPLEKRKPHEVDQIPQGFAYASLMASVETCGRGPGCHQGIVEDHRRSSHNRSIHTSYFQKNLDFMAEEIGEHNTYICAGCHFPNAYFLKDTTYRDYATRDAYSCLYCHTVDKVLFTEEKEKTILVLRPNVQHLKMFASSNGEDGPSFLNQLMIRLSPRAHAKTFRKDLYFREEFCQVCHHLQIKPSENTGFMKAQCIDCHMQPRSLIGLNGKERNHFFPGTNLAGPADLKDSDAMTINTKYSRGEFELALRGWGGIWSLIPKEERTIKDIWLLVQIEPLVLPVAGQRFEYRIVTTNTSLDHAFPAAPLDLIEVWLETWIKDAKGRLVFSSGMLTEDYTIPHDTHKLGGYMIGMDDHLVTKNRVWQIKKKVVEREIHVNHQVQDTYSCVLPEDVEGPLEIYASWNYRKLNQEFVNWAYDNSGMTVPVLRIAEVLHKVDLEKLVREARHSPKELTQGSSVGLAIEEEGVEKP